MFGPERLRTKLILLSRRVGATALLICWVVRPMCASADPLVARYRAATCLPFVNQAAPPHSRVWETTVPLRDGSQVAIKGAQMPGGRIVVLYSVTGHQFVAADAGDYVYPSDVRFDARNDLLYVKAAGLAGGIWERTVLFEYDLRQHRLVTRRRVNGRDLPGACPSPAPSR
jgi:hypothetical protein